MKQLTFDLEPVNICCEEHLEAIKRSIKKNGYDDSYPIFYSSRRKKLITGSHRYRACKDLNIEPVMIDISNEVEAYLYANDMDFDEIDFEYINDYRLDQLYDYFSHYENDYEYGKCQDCGIYTDISEESKLCVECSYIK